MNGLDGFYIYSNHPNTGPQKLDHSPLERCFGSGFWTVKRLKTRHRGHFRVNLCIFSPVFEQTFENKTTVVWFLDGGLKTSPFDVWMLSEHSKTGLIRFLDGYCIHLNVSFHI